MFSFVFLCLLLRPRSSFFFFFNDTATTEIYTLSLHDALPIWPQLAAAHGTVPGVRLNLVVGHPEHSLPDRKSTRLNSSHSQISYAVFCLKKKKIKKINHPKIIHTAAYNRHTIICQLLRSKLLY